MKYKVYWNDGCVDEFGFEKLQEIKSNKELSKEIACVVAVFQPDLTNYKKENTMNNEQTTSEIETKFEDEIIELAGDVLDCLLDDLEELNSSSEEFKEILGNIVHKEKDFIISDKYRFLHEDILVETAVNEFKFDTYTLGCFNSWFIADNTDLSEDIVKALQEANKFDAIGQHIINNDFIDDFIEAYLDQIGYAHHFSTYDGDTQIESLLNHGYYIFRIG